MKLTLILAAAVAATALTGPAAAADGCATHGEYDSLEWGLSTTQVSNRLDTSGWFIGITDNENFFKRGYNTCWDGGRKIVVWYDLDLGLSDHWDVRDK